MLETYGKNVLVIENQNIPLTSVSVQKGCTAIKTAADTIQLNKCGVYMIEFDCSGSITGTTAGTISVQLAKDGVLQPQAFTASTPTANTDIRSMSFNTLVQVRESNSCKCCDSPTVINLVNTGLAATYTQVNATVTKIC